MALQDKLRSCRKESGITQIEAAERLEVSRQTISRWEAGTSIPTTDNLMRLSALYGVSMDEWTKDTQTPDICSDSESNTAPSFPAKESVIEKQPKSPWLKRCVSLIAILLTAGLIIGGLFLFKQRNSSVSMDDLEGEVIDLDSSLAIETSFLPIP